MYQVDYEHVGSSRISDFLAAVYGWMSVGLILTAATAYYVAQSPQFVTKIFMSPSTQVGLFLMQIILVLALSFLLSRMNFIVAAICFVLYAMSLGVTLSVILRIYTPASVGITFLTTAGMFGVMSLYGFVTRRDLTGIGSVSMMMLFGLIIALFINIFMQSETMDYVFSALGVIIFTLLTAYDTQKLRQIAQKMHADQETQAKVSLMGALMLYLDFINLFLFLLRFMGQRRD